MAETYLGTDVFKMAVMMEKIGSQFYKACSQKNTNDKVQKMFEYLAEEEDKHITEFEELLKFAEKTSQDNPFIEPVNPEFIKAIISGRVFPVNEDISQVDSYNLKQAIQLSLTLEKDTIMFYHEMLNLTSHHDVDLVKRILDEERDHILKILDLKKALNV